MNKEKTLAVNAICNGTVIDHIPAGQALNIAKFLNLEEHPKAITLGLNLCSGTDSHKDILKIEEKELTPEEANQITLFAPEATINIITNYEVVKKFQVAMPDTLSGHFACPNAKCITNFEAVETLFHLTQRKFSTLLRCHYCCQTFTEEALT